MELARTIAAQWRTYMEAGMPKWCAGNLVCGYQEAVLRPDEETVEVYGDE